RNAKNFAVVITRAGAASLKQAGITNPAEYFQDKKIRATGTVKEVDKVPRIEIEDANQIKRIDVGRSDAAEVAKALEKAGGEITRNDKQPDKPVVAVILWGPTFKAEMLKELKQFNSLQNLRIGGPWITDVGVKDLKDLKNLQLLEIRSPNVTDAALKD